MLQIRPLPLPQNKTIFSVKLVGRSDYTPLDTPLPPRPSPAGTTICSLLGMSVELIEVQLLQPHHLLFHVLYHLLVLARSPIQSLQTAQLCLQYRQF